MFKLPEYCFYTRRSKEIAMLHRHRYGFIPVSSPKTAYYFNGSLGVSGIKVCCMYLLANYIWLASAPSKWKALTKTALTLLGAVCGLLPLTAAVWGIVSLFLLIPPMYLMPIIMVLNLLLFDLFAYIMNHTFTEAAPPLGVVICINALAIVTDIFILGFCLHFFPELEDCIPTFFSNCNFLQQP